MHLKIGIIAYLVAISASNTADNKVQFEFKEYDFKETNKNVSLTRLLKIDKNFLIIMKLFFVLAFLLFTTPIHTILSRFC
jgi:hypothetical protein